MLAQNNPPPPPPPENSNGVFDYDGQYCEMQSVEFVNALDIKYDGNYTTKYKKIWYLDIPADPIAYQCGQFCEVKAKFNLICNNPPEPTVRIRGIGTDGVNPLLKFPAQSYTIPWSSTIEYNGQAVAPFPEKRPRYCQLKITWEIQFKTGGQWHSIGESENPLYVTWRTPKEESSPFCWPSDGQGCGPYYWQRSLYDITCKAFESKYQNYLSTSLPSLYASWEVTQEEVLNIIWEKIATLELKTWAGNLLHYWIDLVPVTSNTVDLLAGQTDILNQTFHHGQCYAFTQLMIDLLKIQGYSYLNEDADFVYLKPKPNITLCGITMGSQPDHAFFLVKKWTFNTANCPNYCPDAIYTTTELLQSDELQDVQGLAGQSSPNPIAKFQNHSIVIINGKYYDPSYGLGPYNTLDEYSNGVVAGYGVWLGNIQESNMNCDINQDGLISTEVINDVVRARKGSEGFGFSETISNH